MTILSLPRHILPSFADSSIAKWRLLTDAPSPSSDTRDKSVLRSTFLIFVALLSLGSAVSLRADPLDDVISAQMKERNITGLSLAIIDGGKIVKEQGYGFTDKGRKTPVTVSTLFQAGSVSKPVAALGALHLVDKGLLSLDEDVNTKLRTWE